jgi:predicted O-linked N-acetylglucosamine transferase (SPINDLY family)
MPSSQQLLEQSAQSALSSGDYARAFALRTELRSLQPDSVNNLLHLMLLAMHGDGLSLEQMTDLDLSARLELAAHEGTDVDQELVLQALNKYLEEPFLAVETVDFVSACQEVVEDAEAFMAVVFPPATQLGYGRGWAGLAAALTEICLVANPGNINLLMQLPLLCQKANIFDRGVSAARECLEVADNDTDRLNASYILLRGLLNTGGHWDEAVAMVPDHRSRIATVVAASPILSQVDARRLLPTAYLLPYIEDRPEQNHRVQNQLIAVSELSMQTYAQEQYDRYQASHKAKRSKPRSPKLKVGYICHCFHSHSVGWLARWLLQHHDADQIELYAYMINPVQKADYVQEQYRQIVHHVRECGFDGLETAERIYQDGIDILVDLDSLTLDITCEVMALKPAPIQVTWLGWDASGLSAIDYYFADRYVLPENAQDYYVEEIWRLPTTYLAVDGFEVGEADITRAQLDIPEDAVVFYSGQRGYKRHRETTLWQLQIVARVPKGIFLVKGLADQDAVKVFFYELADEVGLDYNRLRFAPQADSEPIHRANLAMADVVLDTFPYNGATTTMEALWMERPLVTLVGEQFAARNSYTMLVNAGIEEGIAWSPEEYIEWGVRLGNDPDLRKAVIEKLRLSKTKAPLWNAKQFAQDVEVAYQQMADRFWSEDETAGQQRQARIDRARAMGKTPIAQIAQAVLVLVNWQAEEEVLEQQLYGLLDRILSSPSEHRFLIDTTGVDEESADAMLGGALMNFLMMQEVELEDEPNMMLVPPLNETRLAQFLTQNFHCAKLLLGDVPLDSALIDRVNAIANY